MSSNLRRGTTRLRGTLLYVIPSGSPLHRPILPTSKYPQRLIQPSVPIILKSFSSTSALMAGKASTSPLATGRTYEEAITALNTLQSNASILAAIRSSGRKLNSLSLVEMRAYLSRIGYIPSDLDPLNIIHISGTKGKGSTCAFTSEILLKHKHILPEGRQKVGLYTSPHLKSVRERIRINGEPISKELFAKYFWEIWTRLGNAAEERGLEDVGGKARPMYFRFLTLLAWHIFLSEGVGALVLEVGIGGEYDSTNLVEKPLATGISRLGIDHVSVLGATLGEIAWHKAGIFKSGVRAFSVQQAEEVVGVLEARAKEREVMGGEVVWVKEEVLPGDTELGLQGGFQKGNAALAVMLVAEALRVITGGEVDYAKSHLVKGELPELVRRGLKETVWEGRCQVVRDGRWGGKLEWCLDGAHTTESLEGAGRWFAEREGKIVQDTAGKKRIRILLFNQQTRDATALLKALHWTLTLSSPSPDTPPLPFFTHVLFTTNLTYRTGYAADLLSAKTPTSDVKDLTVQRALEQEWGVLDPGEDGAKRWVCGSIEEAMERVREIVEGVGEEGVGVVLCTGSLHLVGGVLEVLEGGEGREK